MTKVRDVNTTDILDAIRLGCRMMCNVFNADDNDVPYWRAIARPQAFLAISMEDHISGRHLNALLNAEDAAGVEIDEDCIEKHARAAFLSFSGPLPLSLGRTEDTKTQTKFGPHNVREGLHALQPLVKYRGSKRAQELAEANITAIFEYWDPARGWDRARMEGEHGLSVKEPPSFIIGIARAIGPLVKYYRVTGYGPALELATVLKEKAVAECFKEDGAYDRDIFGRHVHSTTCVMSSLAQLADLTSDSNLMNRVRAFYDNGLWYLRDEIGWSTEGAGPDWTWDEGEMNNTGDILETALILGRWGYTEYYDDAERILRSHLLPSQLRDVSWIKEPANPEGIDGKRNMADRLLGAFGCHAPYGYEFRGPGSPYAKRIRFNTDVVGGAVGSLCEAYRDRTRFDQAGHRVNLLFDCETTDIRVESPYTHPALSVSVKRPGPLFVRIPPWVDRETMQVRGVEGSMRYTNGYLLVPDPPVNRPISLEFPLKEREITLNHQHTGRKIKTRLRGDEVVAMENFGADLTFFDSL